MIDDIPEAKRETPATVMPKSQRNWGLWVGGAIVILVIGAIATSRLMVTATPPTASTLTTDTSDPARSEPVAPTPTVTTAVDHLLGHRAYPEAPRDTLEAITAEGIQLRAVAADRFQAMQDAAWADGINLAPVSGFRSFEDQERLFFEVKAERGQSPTDRAEVSAPPGYSEHHTGYAVDVMDADYPDAYLDESFEDTPAFAWLQEHAVRYGFELSFPPNNPQGVSYEPWHWRFVGDPDSLETFYKESAPTSPLPAVETTDVDTIDRETSEDIETTN